MSIIIQFNVQWLSTKAGMLEAGGGQVGAYAPLDFGRSEGAAGRRITTRPPRFSDLATCLEG